LELENKKEAIEETAELEDDDDEEEEESFLEKLKEEIQEREDYIKNLKMFDKPKDLIKRMKYLESTSKVHNIKIKELNKK